MLLSLLLLICAPLCEPTELLLLASPAQPIEGNPTTLICKSWTHLVTTAVHRRFCFFRDGQTQPLACSSSPELQIPIMWLENSGSYWCEAELVNAKLQRSSRFQINVRRIPVSDVSLEIQPPGGQVMEGKMLVLVCSVAKGTGDITFLWYKGAMGLELGTKTQRSLTAEFEITTARESDAEQYYCAADNGYGPSLSGLVSITVRIPVSHPVLTLRATGAQAVVGDVVELHCEAQRGSPPILYQFYHEDVILGMSSAPYGGGVSFNLTAEHSGNYFCDADNGLGPQHSEAVLLNITVPTKNRKELLTGGVIEGVLSTLCPIIIFLLFCCWLKRRKGRQSARDPPRSPPRPVPLEFTYLNTPTPMSRQPVYENVNVVSGDDVYSLAYSNQQEWRRAAEPQRTLTVEEVSLDIYSKLKQTSDIDVDYEDAM